MLKQLKQKASNTANHAENQHLRNALLLIKAALDLFSVICMVIAFCVALLVINSLLAFLGIPNMLRFPELGFLHQLALLDFSEVGPTLVFILGICIGAAAIEYLMFRFGNPQA